jgi:hypothetical protein
MNKVSKYRTISILSFILLGYVAHWIYLTWDTPFGQTRYRFSAMKAVDFQWDRETGFKAFRVAAYPGDWIGARILRSCIAAQAKPRFARHLRQNTWQRVEGDSAVVISSLFPLVLSDSWGTDSSTFRDPDRTPLMVAMQRDDVDGVKKLIAQGVNPNLQDQNGATALFYALRNSAHAAQMTEIYLNSGGAVDTPDRMGNTPLMKASESGQIAVVKLLLRAGARKDRTNRDGQNASSLARREGHLDIVDLLSSAN